MVGRIGRRSSFEDFMDINFDLHEGPELASIKK